MPTRMGARGSAFGHLALAEVLGLVVNGCVSAQFLKSLMDKSKKWHTLSVSGLDYFILKVLWIIANTN